MSDPDFRAELQELFDAAGCFSEPALGHHRPWTAALDRARAALTTEPRGVRYQGWDVGRIADRLNELANYVTLGPDVVRREFTMRVPAERYRDADLVLSTAAKLLMDYAAHPKPQQVAAGGLPSDSVELADCMEAIAAETGIEWNADTGMYLCSVHDIEAIARAVLARYAAHPAPVPVAIPGDQWHDDDGSCLWWQFPIEEPPYSGSPLDSDWPGYHTHFTRIACPALPLPEPQP